MITANISQYVGMDAEHYYCTWKEVEESFPRPNSGGSHGTQDLKHSLTYAQACALSRKDHYRWEEGTKTNRFDTIEEIHEELQNQFPNQTIVTYEDGQFYKDMLYIKDGVNLGIKAFGEVWVNCPQSVYTDLLPKEGIKIKCCDCGHEYTLDEVTTERDWAGRGLTQFIRKRDMDDPCCDYFDLIWNVIL
jgi:hypothetical protein